MRRNLRLSRKGKHSLSVPDLLLGCRVSPASAGSRPRGWRLLRLSRREVPGSIADGVGGLHDLPLRSGVKSRSTGRLASAGVVAIFNVATVSGLCGMGAGFAGEVAKLGDRLYCVMPHAFITASM